MKRPSRWWHPRKSDIAFGVGMVVFAFNGLSGRAADPTVIYASVALMGFSAAGRVDEWFQNDDHRGPPGGKPPE